jgi:hypothetical protein
VNKVAFASVPVTEMSLHPTTPAGAVVNVEFQASRTYIPLMPFSGSGSDQEAASFVVGLPDDYDGSALSVDIFWTILSGSGTVLWSINPASFQEGDNMAVSNTGFTSSADTALSVEYLNITTQSGTPTGASAGDKTLTVLVRRLAGYDTMAADAQLIKIDVSYA